MTETREEYRRRHHQDKFEEEFAGKKQNSADDIKASGNQTRSDAGSFTRSKDPKAVIREEKTARLKRYLNWAIAVVSLLLIIVLVILFKF